MMCANLYARSQRSGRQAPKYVDPLALEALQLARVANSNLGQALDLSQNLIAQLDDLRHSRVPHLIIQRTPALQLTLPGVQNQGELWAS